MGLFPGVGLEDVQGLQGLQAHKGPRSRGQKGEVQCSSIQGHKKGSLHCAERGNGGFALGASPLCCPGGFGLNWGRFGLMGGNAGKCRGVGWGGAL